MWRLLGCALLGCALALAASPAYAHSGQELYGGWSFDPAIIVALLALDLLYSLGWARMRRRLRQAHGPHTAHAAAAKASSGMTSWRACCFRAGLLVLALALLSPIDTYGDDLLAMHMIQHLLLVLVAPPLLVLGRPLIPLLWALPERGRKLVGRPFVAGSPLRRVLRPLTNPWLAWVLHVGALWLWHLPSWYQAALRDETIHLVEHGFFFGTAMLFWWVVIHPLPGRRPLAYGPTVGYLFGAMLQSSLLGALLAMSRTAWYPFYEQRRLGALGLPVSTADALRQQMYLCGPTHTWGLSALEDQQLAGLLMWVPAGLLYVAAIVAVLVVWTQAEQRRQRRLVQPAKPLVARSRSL